MDNRSNFFRNRLQVPVRWIAETQLPKAKQIESTVRNVTEMDDAELASIAASGRSGVASQAVSPKKLN